MSQVNRTASIRKLILALGLLSPSLFSLPSLAEGSSSSDNTKQLFAETGVTSNNVEHGVTQSQQSWSLHSTFGYKLGQIAMMGISGSSVQYPDLQENLNLRLFFGVKFDLNPTNTLILKYDLNRYFQSGARNGAIVTAEDKFMGYHVAIEQNSNWEGVGQSATWFGFGKELELGAGVMAEAELGYTQLGVVGVRNYFDIMASVGTALSDIFLKLSATTTTQPGQFDGRGGSFLFITANVKFQ